MFSCVSASSYVYVAILLNHLIYTISHCIEVNEENKYRSTIENINRRKFETNSRLYRWNIWWRRLVYFPFPSVIKNFRLFTFYSRSFAWNDAKTFSPFNTRHYTYFLPQRKNLRTKIRKLWHFHSRTQWYVKKNHTLFMSAKNLY